MALANSASTLKISSSFCGCKSRPRDVHPAEARMSTLMCTVFPTFCTLPSRRFATPSCFPISRKLSGALLYFCVDVREITLRSAILDKRVRFRPGCHRQSRRWPYLRCGFRRVDCDTLVRSRWRLRRALGMKPLIHERSDHQEKNGDDQKVELVAWLVARSTQARPSVRLIPSGVSSNAQARTSAMGKPIASEEHDEGT